MVAIGLQQTEQQVPFGDDNKNSEGNSEVRCIDFASRTESELLYSAAMLTFPSEVWMVIGVPPAFRWPWTWWPLESELL